MYYVIIILLLCIDPGERVAHAIQALECDKDVGDVTAVDLMGPGECDTSKRDYDETEVHQLQLIYTEESHSLEVMKCTAVVDRYVAYCGKFWTYRNGWIPTVQMETLRISKTYCRNAFTSGMLVYDHGGAKGEIKELMEIGKKKKSLYYRYGGVRKDGTCFNEYDSFWSGPRSQSEAYETTRAALKIDYIPAKVDLKNNKLTLTKPHLTFKFDEGYTFSPEHGTYTWDTKVTDTCTNVNVLVEGRVNIRRKANSPDLSGAYIRYDNDPKKHFASFLGAKLRKGYCGRECYKVEMSKKIIACLTPVNTPYPFTSGGPNLNMLSYDHVKTAFLSERGRTDFATTGLFTVNYDRINALEKQFCDMERKAIQASINSFRDGNHRALDHLLGENKEVVLAGSMAFVYKCKEVNVTFEPMPGKCYNELPVTIDNDPTGTVHYLDTGNRKLRKVPTEGPCVGDLRPQYYHGGLWHCLNNEGTALTTKQCVVPNKIKPQFNPSNDTFGEMKSVIMGGGLLDEDEINRLFDLYHKSQYSSVANALLGDYAMQNTRMGGEVTDLSSPTSFLGIDISSSFSNFLSDFFSWKGHLERLVLFAGGINMTVGVGTFFWNIYLASKELSMPTGEDNKATKVATRFIERTFHIVLAPLNSSIKMYKHPQDKESECNNKVSSEETDMEYKGSARRKNRHRRNSYSGFSRNNMNGFDHVNIDLLIDEKVTEVIPEVRSHVVKETTFRLNKSILRTLPEVLQDIIERNGPTVIDGLKTLLLLDLETDSTDSSKKEEKAKAKSGMQTETEFNSDSDFDV